LFPKPRQNLLPNSYDYESRPLVKSTGFREYDARWLFGSELNLMGVQALGLGLGKLLGELGVAKEIVVGHDFRSYSASIKYALISGLMAAGVEVHDIGLAITPMAYFAQFALNIPAVAMVTASHNDNGWTGVKMGAARPLTFGPEEMSRLRDIVMSGEFNYAEGGAYRFVEDFPARYIADLTTRPKLKRKLKVVAACGNGTAGAFAPKLLGALGCEVVPLDCDLDFTFPRYNPNPEDMRMLHAMAEAVKSCRADLALGFDGDGDRCGIVDNEGQEIFADKIGVLLARDLSKLHKNASFVVDVKSTGLFASDPALINQGVRVDYWKTGHSHIKRRVRDLKALAGFEKSGHFFFNAPVGRGYDDGFVTAIAVLDMLDRNPTKSMADLCRDLPKTWGSPTMSPHCGRRDQIRSGGARRRSHPRDAGNRRAARRPFDPRHRHRQRRARHRRRWNLGAGARLFEQGGTGGRGGKPGLRGAHARDVRCGRFGAALEPGSRGVQPDDLTPGGLPRWGNPPFIYSDSGCGKREYGLY
jgi:phosphomannomutase/phosphoglucomutase